MSDPATPIEPVQPSLIEQDGSIPETVAPKVDEPAPEAPEEPKPVTEAAPETPKEPEKPKRTPWYQTRIDEITAARRKAETREAELAAKLAKYETTDPDAAPAIKPEQFEQLIEQRAQAIVRQNEFKGRAQAWVQAGSKEFGADKFNEMCAEVAAMGVGDNPEFMAIITDPDIIPDGHKVIAALQAHPDEAQRIIALDPLKQVAALSRLASQPAKEAPKPLSSAPAPIKPVDGSAKSSMPEDTDDIRTWRAKRDATARTTAGGMPNARH